MKAKGFVYYISGIPGSGKSTLAKEIRNQLRELKLKCAILDDEVLSGLKTGDMLGLLMLMKANYDFVLVCTVTPTDFHDWPSFIDQQIFLDISRDIAEKRHSEADPTAGGQDYEYRRHWLPWAKKMEKTEGVTILTSGVKTAKELAGEVYDKLIIENLADLDIRYRKDRDGS